MHCFDNNRPLAFHITTESRRREKPKGNKVEKTKNLRNTGTEGMKIIKSIFGEQLEQDSSWQQHLGVQHRLPGAALPRPPTPHHHQHHQRPPLQSPLTAPGPCWSSGWYLEPRLRVFRQRQHRHSDARRLIKGMICEMPSFYAINHRHKAIKWQKPVI